MSNKPSKEAMQKITSLFGGMAASNAIGMAMAQALKAGYTGIMITFVKEDKE